MARTRVLALLLAFFTSCFALSVSAQQWSGTGRVSGVITGPDGTPVSGAKVTYRVAEEPEAGPEPFLTDDKGEYRFAGLKSGNWVITVEAEGFLPIPPQKTFVYATMNDALRIQLEPIPEEVLRAQKQAQTNKILLRGDQLRAEGKLEEAREAYTEALAKLEEPEQPLVLAALADILLHEGQTEAARQHLARALEIEPGNVPSGIGMMAILLEDGKEAEAEQLLAQLPAEQPVPAAILMRLAQHHYNGDDMEGAKRILDRTLRDHPDTAIAYYFRGLTELNLNLVDTARADLARFLELAPDHPEAAAARDVLGYLPAPSE
jgi:tetratricopeptide (TPR) repeat protein